MRRRKHERNSVNNAMFKTPPNLRAGRGRFLSMKIVFLLLFALVLGRLFQIQVLDGSEYREIAKRQYELQTELPASRGLVYDRSGNILISNTQFVSFAGDPLLIGSDAARVARRFSSVFGKPSAYYSERIRGGRRFVWLERRVSPDYLKKIDPKSLPGIVIIQEPKRLYHYGNLAKDVLGTTNIDNKGIAGVELEFEKRLGGRNGYMIMQRDGKMRTYPSADYPRIEPVNGENLVLTIDLALQQIAEEELRRGIERNEAESGLAVMMNPKTGAVLAMANYPSGTRNRVLTDMFEPGSVFKIVTAAAALEHNIRPGTDMFYAEEGEYRVQLPGNRFRVIRDTEKYEWLSFREAMAFSSNIVMAKLSDEIGAERLYKMSRDFGFGIPTGVELPGEVRGDLKRPVNWSGTTLNTMSYGYEVGVTPIQIAAAYCAAANGGILMRPFIVERIFDGQGRTISETRPQQVRKVVGSATADTLLSFFEDAVNYGTGKSAKVNGVRIAGKTGTARKIVDGKYSIADYTASFVGMFPVEDPQIVCLIMMDNPRRGGYYASGTSAPVFRNIAERIVSTGLLRVPSPRERFIESERGRVFKVSGDAGRTGELYNPRVPDVMYYPSAVAREILERNGYKVELKGEGIVIDQHPPGGTRYENTERILINAGVNNGSEEKVVVPDLAGLSARSAMNLLLAEGLSPDITGSGLVRQQTVRAGQLVPRGTVIRVQCRPRMDPMQIAGY